jgi:hypothetical protein
LVCYTYNFIHYFIERIKINSFARTAVSTNIKKFFLEGFFTFSR